MENRTSPLSRVSCTQLQREEFGLVFFFFVLVEADTLIHHPLVNEWD